MFNVIPLYLKKCLWTCMWPISDMLLFNHLTSGEGECFLRMSSNQQSNVLFVHTFSSCPIQSILSRDLHQCTNSKGQFIFLAGYSCECGQLKRKKYLDEKRRQTIKVQDILVLSSADIIKYFQMLRSILGFRVI